MKTKEKSLTSILLERDGNYPNNGRFPVIIYESGDLDLAEAKDFEEVFHRNNWKNSWRNGIFDEHHYHSNTHEVLGIYRGEANIRFGGPSGETVLLKHGQVVIIPAGVSHKNLGSTPDVSCVGAYPGGSDWDMNFCEPEELTRALENIGKVGTPDKDPLYGKEGPLFYYWK